MLNKALSIRHTHAFVLISVALLIPSLLLGIFWFWREAHATPQAGEAPSNAVLDQITVSSMRFSFRDNSNGETNFRIERSTDGTTFTEMGTVNSTTGSGTGTDYTYTGAGMSSLTANTKYWYKVRACNGTPIASAPGSVRAAVVNPGECTVYSSTVSNYTLVQSATGYTFNADSQTALTVNASGTINSPNPNTGSYTNYIRFELHNYSDTGCNQALLQESGWKNSTSHAFSSLTCGSNYKACIQTRNGDGTANSETGMYAVSTQDCTCGNNVYKCGSLDDKDCDYWTELQCNEKFGSNSWGLTRGASTGVCWQNMCCGDDSGEDASECRYFSEAGSFDCGSVLYGCCDADTDCLYNDGCYDGGIVPNAYSVGVQPDYKSLCYVGYWTDCDHAEPVTRGITTYGHPQPMFCQDQCGYNWVQGGESAIFGEYDSGTATECCGDDANEYNITSYCSGYTGGPKCCNISTDDIDASGNCVAACPSNPNLVIEAAPVIAGNLCISQSQTMTATVKNTGGAISSQTFSTRFQQNGPVTKCEQKKTGVTLNTNQTTDFSCSFTQAATGAVTLYAQADRSDTGSDDDRIAESNESDNQSPNLSVTFITTPSSAPANMRHTANAETSVTWAWDAVSGATSYNLYKSDDGIEFGSDGSTSSTSKTQTTDYPGGAMAANTKYYYKTRTVNTCGSSGDSAVVSAYTSIQSATGASFSGIGQTSFTVAPSNTISAPNPNTGAYTSYIRFELHNGSDIGCTAALLQDSGWKNTASHTFSTGLSCNTAYKVCIQTRNGDGDANSETGMYQVATSACSQPDLVVPSSPSISGNLCVGQAQTFTSTVRNDGPGNASGTISVPYKEGANTLCTGSGAINLNQTQTNTNFSCNFTPASAGTVLVNATADSTNAITESNESNNISTNLNVTFITTPGAAGTPTFSSIGPTSVAVSWTPGTNATTYNLYRCTGAACSPISLLASNITSPYTDSTVSEGNTYGYQVRDSNSCGNGLNSGTGYVPTPSFTLSNNGPVTVNQSGGTQDVIVTVTSVNSFSSLATLSDNCAASNLSCSWPSGNSCTPLAGSTCTRTLRVGAGTATPGAKTVVVTGTATSYTNKTTNVNVTVSDNILPACSSAQARPDSYSGTGEWDNDTTIYFTWTSSDNVGVTTCWAEIGGTPPDEDAGVGGQDTDTGVAGANTYYVQCQDAALNTCAVISDTIGIDLTAPSCGTPSYNPSGWTNGSVTVTISCSDTGGSGCVQASYSSSPISSNGSGSLTIADNAGNTTSCAYNVTNIDVTAPTISVFTVDGAAYGASANNTDGSPNISWTSSDGTGSGVNNAKIWRAPDSGGNPGAWTNVNTSSSASGSWSDSVSNGTYWYGVHSTDNATNCIKGDTSGVDQGHCGGVTSDALDRRIQRDPVRVVVNAACPLPTYTVTDSVNATYNTSDTVALTWTGATSPTGSYGFSADATCDGTDTYPNSGNSTTVSTTHTDYLCFRNNNACGTTYASQGPLRVDTGLPTASFTVAPATGTVNVTSFAVDATASSDNLTSAANLEVRWDWEADGAYDTSYSTTKTSSHIYSTTGAKTIRLQVRDQAGNANTTTQGVTVNSPANQNPNTPSNLSQSPGAEGSTTNDSTPSFTFTISDPDSGDTVGYQIQIDNNSDFSSPAIDFTWAGSTTNPNSVTYDVPSALADNSYYWRARARDGAGLTSAWADDTNGFASIGIDFTVNTTVPDFSLSLSPASSTVTQGTNATYSIVVTPSGGFSSSVGTWVYSNCPAGAACSIAPASCASASYASCATLTITTGSVSPNTYANISVTGTGSTLTRTSNTVSLTVNAPANQNPNTPSSLSQSPGAEGSTTNDPTPTLTFTISDPDSLNTVKYQIQVDNNADFSSPAVDYTSPLMVNPSPVNYTTTSLGDNSWYWRVRATDSNNATSGWADDTNGFTSTGIDFTVDTTAPDTTPPTVTVTGAPGSWQNTNASACLSCSDAGSGCNANRDTLNLYSSNPGTCPTTYNATYAYTVCQTVSSQQWVCGYGEDNAVPANTDTDGPIEFRVDLLSPTITSFTVEDTAMGNAQTIIGAAQKPTAKWNTSDASSGVASVQLWRADVVAGTCELGNIAGCSWTQIWSDTNAIFLSGRDDITAGNPEDYLYGIHVTDTAGNCVLENGQPCVGGTGNPVRIIMNIPSPLTAGFTSCRPDPAGAPNTVRFTNTTTGGTLPYSSTWNFGDGSSNSVLTSPTHNFATGQTTFLDEARFAHQWYPLQKLFALARNAAARLFPDVPSANAQAGISVVQTVTATIASGTPLTLPSWSPQANELVLVAVAVRNEALPISVSGNGLTFVQVSDVDNIQGQNGVTLFRAMGSSPTTGSITITITGNATPVAARAIRFSGVDTSGTNGSGAVEQTATNQGPAADNANMKTAITTLTSGAWAVGVGVHRSATFTVPSGETAIETGVPTVTAGSGGDITRLSAWYEITASPSTVTVGADGDLSAINDWAMIVVSIKPASGGGGPPYTVALSVTDGAAGSSGSQASIDPSVVAACPVNLPPSKPVITPPN